MKLLSLLASCSTALAIAIPQDGGNTPDVPGLLDSLQSSRDRGPGPAIPNPTIPKTGGQKEPKPEPVPEIPNLPDLPFPIPGLPVIPDPKQLPDIAHLFPGFSGSPITFINNPPAGDTPAKGPPVVAPVVPVPPVVPAPGPPVIVVPPVAPPAPPPSSPVPSECDTPFPNGRVPAVGPTDCAQIVDPSCNPFGYGYDSIHSVCAMWLTLCHRYVCSDNYDTVVECYNGQTYNATFQSCSSTLSCLSGIYGAYGGCLNG